MTAGITLTSNPAQDYNEWVQQRQARLEELQKLLSECQQRLEKAQSDFSKLISEQSELDRQKAAIEKELNEGGASGDRRKQLEAQLAALKTQSAKNETQIEAAKEQINTCLQQLAGYTNEIAAFNRDTNAESVQELVRDSTNRNFQRDLQKDAQPSLTASADHLQELFKAAHEQEKNVVEQQKVTENNSLNMINPDDKITTAELQTAANSLVQITTALGIEAQNLIADIVKNQDKRASAETRKQELQDKLTKLYIEIGVASASIIWFNFAAIALVAYLTSEILKTQDELKSAENDIADANAAISKDLEALDGVMAQLTALDRTELMNDINKVLKLAAQLLAIVNSGSTGQASNTNAAVIMVQILSLLQAITAKVAAKKGNDEDWMSKAIVGQFEVSVNDACWNMLKMDEMMAHAEFLKTVMEITQAAMIAASIALAAVTGGAGAALVAAGMGVLMACGVFDKMSAAIAKEWGDSKGAKIGADVVTTAIAIVLTLGATSAVAAAQQGLRVAMARIAEKVAEKVAENVATKTTLAIKAATDQVIKETVTQATENAMKAAAHQIEAEVARQVLSKGLTSAQETALRTALEATAKDAAEKAAQTVTNSAARAAIETAVKESIQEAAKKTVEQTLKEGGLSATKALARAAYSRGSTFLAQEAQEKLTLQLIDTAKNAATSAIGKCAATATEAATSAAQNTITAGRNMTAILADRARDEAIIAVRAGIPSSANVEFFTKEAMKQISDEAAKIVKDMGVKGWMATAGAAALSTGMMVDILESIARAIKSKDELDKDMTYQIIKQVTQVIQAVLMMYLASKMSGAGAGASADGLGSKTFMGMDQMKLLQALSTVQFVGDGITVGANLEMFGTMLRQAHIHERTGYDEANITFYQSMMDHMKKVQETAGEVRASMFEQQMSGITQTIKHMGLAEREAARILSEKAV